MKILLVYILTVFSFVSFAQTDEETVFTISPIFAAGMALPSKVNVVSGNQSVSYIPTSRITSSLVNSTGGASFSLHVTNTIGIEASYKIKSPLWLTASITRSSQINSSQNPYEFNFSGNIVRNWYSVTKYYNFSLAPKKVWNRGNDRVYFGQVALSFSTGFGSPLEQKNANNTDSGNFVENGTGVKVEAYNGSKNTFVLTPEFGYKANENFPLYLSLSASIPFLPIYTERYTFYQNSRVIGTNTVNLNQAAIWLNAKYTIDVLKKKEKKEKPEKIKKEKPPKEEKAPIIVKKEKEKVDFGNKKIEEGEKIVLKNITFEQTKSTLNSSGMTELDIVADLMKQYPKMRIEITGHTSSEGDRYDNIELSRKRAEACKDYLKKKGVEGSRVFTKGVGPDAPISTTDKSLNRRVEFVVLKVN